MWPWIPARAENEPQIWGDEEQVEVFNKPAMMEHMKQSMNIIKLR